MVHRELTEKDLSVDEKKVLGKIIDLWSLGRPEDPYVHSTERQVMKYSEKEGLSNDKIAKILSDLESYGLIHRSDEGGETRIKYRVEAAHLVKELQKTAYVNSSMEKFTPPRR